MPDFDYKHSHNFSDNAFSLGISTLSNDSDHKLLILLKTNPKGLDYLFKYLNNLDEWKKEENDIDWVNYELCMAQYYSCQLKEINNLMIELYKAGKYIKLCEDYSLYKGLGTYQRMVSN